MTDEGKAVTAVVESYKAAVRSKDAPGLISLYAPDVVVFDLWGELPYQGADAWRRSVEDWFGSLGPEHVEVEFEVVRAIESPEMAFVEAFVLYKAVAGSGETLRAMRNRLSWVLRPQAGAWQIAHEHTSAPADPATLKVILDAGDRR